MIRTCFSYTAKLHIFPHHQMEVVYSFLTLQIVPFLSSEHVVHIVIFLKALGQAALLPTELLSRPKQPSVEEWETEH